MSHQRVTTDSTIPSLLPLNVSEVELTDKQFEQLCRANPDLRIELTSRGELIIMPPTGLKTGWRNGKTTYRLGE